MKNLIIHHHLRFLNFSVGCLMLLLVKKNWFEIFTRRFSLFFLLCSFSLSFSLGEIPFRIKMHLQQRQPCFFFEKSINDRKRHTSKRKLWPMIGFVRGMFTYNIIYWICLLVDFFAVHRCYFVWFDYIFAVAIWTSSTAIRLEWKSKY